ncbi:hypothetical protein PFISCL1PPCAC_24115, partial [Pristionchus fissidentatus]
VMVAATIKATSFCDQDFVSYLPDGCLFEVFSYLNRDDMDNMEIVSKKMHFFANLQIFKHVKKNFRTLLLKRNESTDEFHLLQDDKAERHCLCSI